MPRQPRFVLIGHPQHVIIRGNDREPIFYVDKDYQYYLEKLEQACNKHECEVHAYVLMTNHVHLLITPYRENGVSKAIQMLGRYYVQYFNKSYKRTGTLWEGRYKASLVDSANYALTCYRYIELNPVRANMVKHPAEYPWSSYRFNGVGKSNSLVIPHKLYLSLGSTFSERCTAYRELFNGHINEMTLDLIREATNKSWVVGNDYFKKKISKEANRQVEPIQRGGDRRSKEFKVRGSNRV